MIDLLKKYTEDSGIILTGKKLLLGVSGGIDSMVLLKLLTTAGYTCQVAHCNFKLRGDESDLDELFVKKHCETLKVRFHSVSFDTEEYCRKNGISIQMAARELRYEWFEKVRLESGLDYICLAHNRNDTVETFMINLSRGTGINGLCGIRPVNGRIIRPLLFASREMIEKYARKNSIGFREDSSNSEIKYLRNRVRHLILPQFDDIQNNSVSSINETIEKLNETSLIFNDAIEATRRRLISSNSGYDSFEKDDLKNLTPVNTYLFELFRPYGLTPGQVQDLKLLLNSDTGKFILTGRYRIISDRNRLVIAPLSTEENSVSTIDNEDQLLANSKYFIVKRFSPSSSIPLGDGSKVWIDGDKLKYPLTIRRWEKGDSFYPFGMNGKKKISDLIIDNKIPLHKKETVMVLLSRNMVVWVIGIRADNRFRISDDSKKIFELSLRI